MRCLPPYFTRTFGLNYAQVGLIIGLVGGFSQGIGTLAGGFITDRMAKMGHRWYALVPAIGLAIATPIYFTAYVQPDWKVAAMILLLPGVFWVEKAYMPPMWLHMVVWLPLFAIVGSKPWANG